jgi:hypothetical protein
MDLGRIGEQIKLLSASAAGAFQRLRAKLEPLADKVLARIPEEKRRPVLFCLGGTVVLLLVLIVIMLVMSLGRGGAGELSPEIAGPPIPQEELFFPGEPDFVPPLLLEREPRHSWAADDARPFWKDPGELGREQWQREMGAVIDKLMDSVP